MDDGPPLHIGNELHCPHCRGWHPIIQRHADGTEYTRQMLYWECRGRDFYAGQRGSIGRHETRRANTRSIGRNQAT